MVPKSIQIPTSMPRRLQNISPEIRRSPIMRLRTLPFLTLLSTLTLASPLHPASCVPPQYISNSSNTYDYIVTGSGPGGGTIATNLARAGHSVLLIEAGSDASTDIRTQILGLNDFSSTNVAWHFFVKHDDDEERLKRYNLLIWKLENGDCKLGLPCSFSLNYR